METKITITKRCMCSKVTAVSVPEDQWEKYLAGTTAQVTFPTLNKFEREVLISGMCFDCQSKLFHMPKPGEDWGPLVGECPNCDCPIYPIDIKDGVCKCASCGMKYRADDTGVNFSEEI